MPSIRSYVEIAVDLVRSSATVRRGLLTAIVLLISVPFVVYGSDLGLKTMFNAPLRWIPHDSESRQQFNEFLDLFNSHELIVISWEGCEVDDERLKSVELALCAAERQRLAEGKQPIFAHVLSGFTMLELLTREPIELSRAAALRRLKGAVVGQDEKASCVVVEVTDYGAKSRRETLSVIIETVEQTIGIPRTQLVLAGPPIEGIAIDDESIRSVQRYSLASIFISLVLCWICLRSFWFTLPILVVGAIGQGLMLATVYYLGDPMNAILIVLPPLVFVLTVSAGVHLVNYFIEESRKENSTDAARRAVANARGPCAMAAVTTAIGLASLCVSEVAPVRQFGLLGAVGLLVCVGLLFLLVPAFMVVIQTRPGWAKSTAVGPQRHSFLSITHFIVRHGFAIRWTCFLAMGICAIGLARLRTTIDVVSLLSAENRAVQDFRWFENKIGPLIPVEVIVYFDRTCELDSLQRLKVVKAVEQTMGHIENLGGVMSAATFVPALPVRRGLRGSVRRTVFEKRLERSRDDLMATNYFAETKDGEAYRVSGRVRGIENMNHGQFLDEIRREIAPIAESIRKSGYQGVTMRCTGVTAVAYEIQQTLLDNLFSSFLIALLLVAMTMVFALRSVICGLFAMLPNIFPATLVFGSMGLSDRAIDIGSVMTASVALGIAVDGTFHFLKWFVESLKAGQSREQSIVIAYQHCGRALIQTTIICALGLLVFTLSGFLPARNFAWMLLWMLVAALFGDLVFLPALLAGRLGRLMSSIYLPRTSDEKPQGYAEPIIN